MKPPTERVGNEAAKKEFYELARQILDSNTYAYPAVETAVEELSGAGRPKLSEIRDKIVETLAQKAGYRLPIAKFEPEDYEALEKLKHELFVLVTYFRVTLKAESRRHFGAGGDSHAGHSSKDD